MGSGKLIPLPQVLSVLTWFSAYHRFPVMLYPVCSNRQAPGSALAGIAWPVQVRPDLVQHNVSHCPTQPSQTNVSLTGFVWLENARLDFAYRLPRSALCVFLVHVFPLQVICGLVISLVTWLDTLVCTILPSRHRPVYPLRNKPV